MNANRNQCKHEDEDIPDHEERLSGHKIWEQLVSEGVDLVTRADEDEGGQEDIDHGVVRDQDQNPASVRTQEDMVLGYQHLDVKTTYPREEAGVSWPHKPRYISQQSEANDWEKWYVWVNLIAVHFVPVNTKGYKYLAKIYDNLNGDEPCWVEQKRYKPAEKRENSVWCEADDSQHADPSTDAPGPQWAVVTVVIQLEPPAHHGHQGEDASRGDGVAVQLPAEPPLVDIVIRGDEERLPRPRDEHPLEEDLREVEHGDEAEQPGELEDGVEVLSGGGLGGHAETFLEIRNYLYTIVKCSTL